jgi:hypothetical protein
MNKGEWIGIAAIVIGAFFSSVQILLQWLSMRPPRGPAAGDSNRRLPAGAKFEWRVPKWLLRIANFLIQTAAVYFLLMEYRSSQPLTRHSVVIIACMTALISICFVVPLIIGVYNYLETLSTGSDA